METEILHLVHTNQSFYMRYDAFSRILRKRIVRSRGWRLHLKHKSLNQNCLCKPQKMKIRYFKLRRLLTFMHSQWTCTSHQGCFGHSWAQNGTQLCDGMINLSMRDTYAVTNYMTWRCGMVRYCILGDTSFVLILPSSHYLTMRQKTKPSDPYRSEAMA